MQVEIKNISPYEKLMRRNRIILALRFIVPILGLIVFGFLMVQIFIANLGANFEISGIRIQRENVLINNPQYSGITANGTNYSVTSKQAITTINSGNVFDLREANFEMIRNDGLEMNANAKQAIYNLIEQNVIIDEEMFVNDSRGIRAKLTNSTIDWNSQSIDTRDKVEIVFSDGSTLNSNSLVYDSVAQTWNFNNVELIIVKKDLKEN